MSRTSAAVRARSGVEQGSPARVIGAAVTCPTQAMNTFSRKAVSSRSPRPVRSARAGLPCSTPERARTAALVRLIADELPDRRR